MVRSENDFVADHKTLIPLIDSYFLIKNEKRALFWHKHQLKTFGRVACHSTMLINLIFSSRLAAISYFKHFHRHSRVSPEITLRSLQIKIVMRAVQENQVEVASWWLELLHRPLPHGLDAPVSSKALTILLKSQLDYDNFSTAGKVIKSIEKLGVDSSEVISKYLESHAERG